MDKFLTNKWPCIATFCKTALLYTLLVMLAAGLTACGGATDQDLQTYVADIKSRKKDMLAVVDELKRRLETIERYQQRRRLTETDTA